MAKEFDLVIIGSGSAGRTAASLARVSGWEVAVAEKGSLGGTCPLRGCLPKKVLVGAAEAMDWNMRMKGKGVVPGNAHIEWSELMEFKRRFTDTKPKRIE